MAKKRSGGKKQGNQRSNFPPARSSAPPSAAPKSAAPPAAAKSTTPEPVVVTKSVPPEAVVATKSVPPEAVVATKSVAPGPKSMRPAAPTETGVHPADSAPPSSSLADAVAAEAEKQGPAKVDAPKEEPKVEAAKPDEPTKSDAKIEAKSDSKIEAQSDAKIEAKSDSKIDKAGPKSEKMPMSKGAKSLRGDAVADAFFSSEQEAVERAHAEELRALHALDHDDHGPRPPSASELERRAKLRRVVIGVLGLAAAVALIAGVRTTLRPKNDPTPTAYAATIAPKTVEPVKAPPPKIDPPKAELAAAAPPPDDDEKIADGGAAPSSSAKLDPAPVVAADSASPGSDALATKPSDPEAAKKLTKAALARLEAGDFKNAIEQAKASVDADPTDANAYLYWGTALMETGKTGAAREVFKTCVATATHGPKLECRHFQ